MKPLSNHKTKKVTVHKKSRFNPHRYWAIFFTCFILGIILELGYFTWYFQKTTKTLDAPATPALQTNAAIITTMERTLKETEDAVRVRMGTIPASQNTPPVVQ